MIIEAAKERNTRILASVLISGELLPREQYPGFGVKKPKALN
jgi:hypothetical protein